MFSKFSVFCVIVAFYFYFKSGNRNPIANNQEGYYAPGWERVIDLYRQHLDSGWQGGGAFAVYYKGKLVAEISGGYADEKAKWQWTNTTLSQMFSTTKAMGSMVMAMLVDRGLIEYNKPVSKYWPEFAQNGKKDVTVEQLLSHRAGLVVLDEPFAYTDILHNNDKISKIFGAQKPNWVPGTAQGYHTLSIGIYEDQIVRRVDPKKRSLSKFFAEEVAKPFGIDIFVGLPKNQHYRCARNIDKMFFFISDWLQVIRDWQFYYNLINKNSLLFKSVNNPPNMDKLDELYNHPEYRQVPNAAASGFGTAIAVAKVFGILSNGGVHNGKRLMSEKTIKLLTDNLSNDDTDVVLGRNGGAFGRGHSIFKSPRGTTMFGAPGAGSQVGKADIEYKVGIGYITNHMTLYGKGNDPKYLELENLVYDIVDEIEGKKKK